MTDFSIIFVFINTIVVIKLCRSKRVHTLLKVLLAVSFFGWNAIPALLMYAPQMFGSHAIVNDTYILCSYYNEIYLFFAYNLAYFLIEKKRIPGFLVKNSFQDSQQVLNVLVKISIFLSCYKLFMTMTSSTSYFEKNDLANYSALGPVDLLSGYAFNFLVALIFFFKKKLKPNMFRLCVIIVVSDYLLHTIRGGRIYIFGVVIILIYYALVSERQKRARTIFSAGLVGAFSLLMLPILASLRGDTLVKADDIVEASSTQVRGSIMEEILTKTNSVMYGSYLIDHDGIGRRGGLMYSSTAFALFPRFLFPSKPEAGSVNGRLEGLPARASVIYSTIGDYNGMGNNGVPSSLSSLWGGGWLAYIIELITTGYLIFLINSIFNTGKPIFTGFVFSLLSFPVGVLEVPLPTILISLQRYILIYVLLYLVLSPLSNKQKTIQK